MTLQPSPIELALSKVGKKESGRNGGSIVTDFSKTPAGLPWCSGFVTAVFDKSGYEDVFKGCSNKLSVPSVMEHGKVKGLSESLSKVSPPPVGSVVSFKGQNHVGMVTAVHSDGTFDVTQGNTSDAVKTIRTSKGEIDNMYLSGAKIQEKFGNGKPMLAGSGAIPTQQDILGQLTTPQEDNTAKPPTLEQMYQQQKQQSPDGDLGSLFMQIFVAALLTTIGKEANIPSQQAYKADPNAGLEALKKIDAERSRTPSALQAVNGSEPVAPSKTPAQSVATNQNQRWD
jgi:CHAP domain